MKEQDRSRSKSKSKKKRKKRTKRSSPVDVVRGIRETVNEAKELVKDLDELFGAIGGSKIASFFSGTGKRDYEGEVVEYEDEVVVNQEIPVDSKPKVRYSNGKIVIEFDGVVKEYEVGDVDTESITAERRFSTLTVRAKKKKVEKEEGDKDGSEGSD